MYPIYSSVAADGRQPPAVCCISLGCPKNRVDSEQMLASLGALKSVEDPGLAEIVLINTCGFIEPAVQESVGTILETVVRLRNLDPKPLLVVAGCLVARFGLELRMALPEVDVWLGVRNQGLLPEKISDLLQDGLPLRKGSVKRLLSTGPSYAYLKIGEGCNHRCRFCTIPSIRGRLASKPVPEVLNEARHLLDQGVSELVLVAQDVTFYGRDLGMDRGLERLVSSLVKLPGLRWLRLMYLYPAGLSPRLLRFLADSGPVLLPYFDLPLQHAHPEILSAMGRPFARDPGRIIDRIRERIPQACLRTSLIVGFPGERPHHFRVLREFVARTRFTHLGVFAYCPEPGTPAASQPGQVGTPTKAARREELMRLQAVISAEILALCRGREMDILVDRPSPEWPGLHEGRTWFQAPEVDGVTYISGEGVRPGRIVRASIQESKTYDLVALR